MTEGPVHLIRRDEFQPLGSNSGVTMPSSADGISADGLPGRRRWGCCSGPSSTVTVVYENVGYVDAYTNGGDAARRRGRPVTRKYLLSGISSADDIYNTYDGELYRETVNCNISISR